MPKKPPQIYPSLVQPMNPTPHARREREPPSLFLLHDCVVVACSISHIPAQRPSAKIYVPLTKKTIWMQILLMVAIPCTENCCMPGGPPCAAVYRFGCWYS